MAPSPESAFSAASGEVRLWDQDSWKLPEKAYSSESYDASYFASPSQRDLGPSEGAGPSTPLPPAPETAAWQGREEVSSRGVYNASYFEAFSQGDLGSGEALDTYAGQNQPESHHGSQRSTEELFANIKGIELRTLYRIRDFVEQSARKPYGWPVNDMSNFIKENDDDEIDQPKFNNRVGNLTKRINKLQVGTIVREKNILMLLLNLFPVIAVSPSSMICVLRLML